MRRHDLRRLLVDVAAWLTTEIEAAGGDLDEDVRRHPHLARAIRLRARLDRAVATLGPPHASRKWRPPQPT